MNHPLLKWILHIGTILSLLIAGLDFYGVISVGLGELFFFAAWAFSLGLYVYYAYQWDAGVSTKIFFGVVVAFLLGASLFKLNSWALAHRHVENAPILLPQNTSPPKLPPIQRPPAPVLSPNDIKVVACNNPLKLNTEIHSSTKFDGPQDCTLIITSDSKVMLKNALLQIRVMPRTVKINTIPPFTPVPDSPSGETGNILLQIPIDQTVAKGGVPFTVLLELPRSSKRYGLRFQIITDDGRMLGWWAVDIIPAHESG